ncbi:MAG: phosphoribosylamine--glycine ligase N-terminal domain-containing protein, partial [Patescibacteria group bacterium]
MNVLIVGKGGREHALGWKMRQSPALERLYFMPGNAGTAQIGTNIHVDPHMHSVVLQFCQENSVGLVVIGPDEYLADGLTD